MPTFPYLHFRGDCAAAMTFYAKALDGTDLQMMPYSQTPGGDPRPEAEARIMHAQVTLGDGTLMASDFPPGTEGDAQRGVSVMQVAPTPATAREWFDRLADGGSVIHPFGPTFFASAFGMVKDRFGTHWIISALPQG